MPWTYGYFVCLCEIKRAASVNGAWHPLKISFWGGVYQEVLFHLEVSLSDKLTVRNWFFFVLFFIFRFACLAAEFGANDRFQNSLSLLNELQSPYSCTKEPKFAGHCSDTLNQLIEDDKKNRLVIFKSMAPHCRTAMELSKSTRSKDIQDFKNPELLQQAFQTNKMAYLGEASHESIKTCMLRPETKNNDVISKFYYYAARLNDTAGKIAQEQVTIDRYLKEKNKTTCPNPNLLTAANDICQTAQSCANQETFEQLLARVPQEEELYIQTKAALKKNPDKCEEKDENCKKEKAALSALLAGLIEKNPWFMNPDFNSQKNRMPNKYRLETYLKVARENLKKQQTQLEKAAMCIHNSNKEECSMDDLRETLAMTAAPPEISGGSNPTEKILNNYMNYQSCLEDWSLERNRASGVFGDAFKNAGLGLLVLPIGARWAAAKAGKIVLAEAAALIGADVVLNVLSSRDSWKGVAEKCFSSDHITFEFKKLPQQEICEKSNAGLSRGSQEKSACLINAGLSTLSVLPFAGVGYNVVRFAQSSGILKSANVPLSEAAKAAQSTAQNATNSAKQGAQIGSELRGGSAAKSEATAATEGQGRRAADAATQGERRQGGALKNISCVECRAEKIIDHPAMPNLPKNMRIIEGEKIDGSKGLFYKHPEQLPDGSWVATVREFQIDDVTGGIAANFPAGRELFEKIALEKAGKAYFAFFDVGSLRFVNKTFKAGEEAGDRYLKGVADKIREIGGDKITLARTGGDEFGLIVDEVDPVKAKALIKKIQDAIREDFKGDAKRVFFEEKAARAKEFREALAKLEAENPQGVSTEQKAALLARIEEIKKVSQPDISIGITQIGSADTLAEVAARTEEQAKQMKISSALEFGRSAEKYGSKEAPNLKPNQMYLAPIADPIPSVSWKPVTTGGTTVQRFAGSVDDLPLMGMDPKDEILRFSNMSVVRFEDQLGRSIYKTERFITDATGKRVPVISEIPTRGSTGLLDGTHSEGRRLISSFIESQPNSFFVMPKLRGLKYLNYFESGTQAGDRILEAVADVIKKNTRPYDLNFKLGGADFLMGVKNKLPSEMKDFYQKVTEQLKVHPLVKEVLAKESAALMAKLEKAKALKDTEAIAEVQQRIRDLANFDLDLQFQSVQKNELSAKPTLKEIEKKFEGKFPQN